MKYYALVLSLCTLGVASAGMAAGPGSGGGSGHPGGSCYAGGVRPGSHGPGTANNFASTGYGLAGSSAGGSPTVQAQRGVGALPTPRNKALMALRAEGLKLREQDGGKLTQEHRATLQARLNSINGVPSAAH
jgi:hypothetical protein